MGDLLLNWLNDEIQLSKRVTNFEQDFHNGFLFGQLLAKYSQQLNFHEFVDKDDKASRIKNYSLLLQTFSALKVTYDSNVAMRIINKQLGVAKKLLYQLKTQLQKTNANTFSRTNRMNKTLSPLKKIQISKEKFDQVNKDHFMKQLNELHPAQKEIIQDKLLKKFGDFHNTMNIKVIQQEQKQRQSQLLLRSKFNQQQRDNLKKSQDFRKQWEAEHQQKWVANMSIRQTQMAKDEQYKSKIQFEKNQYKTMSELNALKSLKNDISEFEKKNLNSKKKDDSDDESLQQTNKFSQKHELLQTGQVKVREEARDERKWGAAQTDKKKQQRQKRRRKMIVQQQKRYQMIQITRRQRCIINTIQQISKQQKEIQYQIWRAWQNKSIIIQNKNLYVDKIKQKQQIRQINAKFKRDQLLKVYRQQHKHEVKTGVNNHLALYRNNQVKNRKDIYKTCQKMIFDLLNITQDMYIKCQQSNINQIKQNQLSAAMIRFVQGTSTQQQQNLLRLKHYINGTHEWNMKIVRPAQEVPLDPQEDNALPNDNVNNYFLGNILHNIFSKLYSEQYIVQQDKFSQKLIICLIGLDFARKNYLASKTKELKGFNIISIDRLIENKLADWQKLKQKELQISIETQQLAQQCFSGKPISQAFIINLIKQQIQKHKNSILLDYPNTYEQAISLCKVLGGVEPSDLLAKSRLKKKIEEYERLVKGTQCKIVQRKISSCGVDFVIWIDASVQNSLDRMLGRRMIGDQVVHINEDVEPFELKEGKKSAALVINNHFKLNNKENLHEWFNLFGKDIQLEEAIQSKCWDQIDGNCQKQELEKIFIEKIENALKIKEKQSEWKSLQQSQAKKRQQQEIELQQKREEIKSKCILSNPETIKGQLNTALSQMELDKEFLQKTTDLWSKIQTTSISSYYKTFESLQQQQNNKRKHISKLKRSFISLLTRQDHKFLLIKDFQLSYNRFITQNEDMVIYEYTKEQLHQRVEDLQNDLLGLIDEKKEDAVNERVGIINSGWLESQFDIINQCLFVLIQTELNKFGATEKLITDYYAKRFMANTKAYQPLNSELNVESFQALQIFKDGVTSRLDKMISEALRILNREEDLVEDKNKKGGKVPPPKKDEKKGAKKGQVEEVKQPTAHQIELKKAINTQKAIVRQRLNRIKTMGITKLKNTYQSAQKLYTQLEDLLVYTERVQKKAILGLTKIFRKSIENEQKIQNQVSINHVEVTHTKKIRNHKKQQPIIEPARQNIQEAHFTISNIYQLIKLIKNQSQGSRISTKKLIALLKKIIFNPQLKKLIPETWQQITNEQIQSFVQLLDHQNKAYIDLVNVLIFIALSGYTLPTNQQIKTYTLNLTNYSSLKESTLQHLANVEAWFDQQLQIKQHTRVFERNQYIKQILFNIFCNEGKSTIDIDRYLFTISLQQFVELKQKGPGTTYFDFAFHS